MKFKNQNTRAKILKHCRNLEITIQNRNYPVYFSMDRTKLQDKKLFTLREQKRAKAENGETRLGYLW